MRDSHCVHRFLQGWLALLLPIRVDSGGTILVFVVIAIPSTKSRYCGSMVIIVIAAPG